MPPCIPTSLPVASTPLHSSSSPPPPPPAQHCNQPLATVHSTRPPSPPVPAPLAPDGAFPCHARQSTCHPLPALVSNFDVSVSVSGQPVRQCASARPRQPVACRAAAPSSAPRTPCRRYRAVLAVHWRISRSASGPTRALAGSPAEPRDRAASAARLLVRWAWRSLAAALSLRWRRTAASGGAVRGTRLDIVRPFIQHKHAQAGRVGARFSPAARHPTDIHHRCDSPIHSSLLSLSSLHLGPALLLHPLPILDPPRPGGESQTVPLTHALTTTPSSLLDLRCGVDIIPSTLPRPRADSVTTLT